MILRRINKVYILNKSRDIFATVRLFYEKIMKFRGDTFVRETGFSRVVPRRTCLISAQVPFIDRV